MSTERIANFIAECTYEQLPEQGIKSAKEAILDCLGVTLAGCGDPGSRLITEYVKEEGGKSEAGVVGSGFKTLASEAAWANGTLAHALDYDDYAISFLGHPTVALLPAVFSLGEKHHLTGKDILLSYIVGLEAGGAIGPFIMQSYILGWHGTSVVGTMGAAAAAAKALKLGNQESRMALGIAASLANGLKENFGTMTKPLHAGNAARNGVIAATLAQRGFTANENILEAPQGFCKVLSGGVQTDLSHLGEGIGKQFNTTMGLAMKPYPSCAGTHASIDNALYLKREYDVSAEEVEEVELRINPAVKTATLYSRPQTGTEGKFSNEYCIARALLEGEVGLKHFTDEKVKEAKAQELLQKVKWIDSTKFAMGSEVVVKLKDGREFSHKVDAPKGSMTSPLTWEDICIKYRDCASLVLSQKEVEHSLEIISHLEELEDTNTLMDILTFGGKKAGS